MIQTTDFFFELLFWENIHILQWRIWTCVWLDLLNLELQFSISLRHKCRHQIVDNRKYEKYQEQRFAEDCYAIMGLIYLRKEWGSKKNYKKKEHENLRDSTMCLYPLYAIKLTSSTSQHALYLSDYSHCLFYPNSKLKITLNINSKKYKTSYNNYDGSQWNRFKRCPVHVCSWFVAYYSLTLPSLTLLLAAYVSYSN